MANMIIAQKRVIFKRREINLIALFCRIGQQEGFDNSQMGNTQ